MENGTRNGQTHTGSVLDATTYMSPGRGAPTSRLEDIRAIVMIDWGGEPLTASSVATVCPHTCGRQRQILTTVSGTLRPVHGRRVSTRQRSHKALGTHVHVCHHLTHRLRRGSTRKGSAPLLLLPFLLKHLRISPTRESHFHVFQNTITLTKTPN